MTIPSKLCVSVCLCILAGLATPLWADDSVLVQVNKETGVYQITVKSMGWQFAGSLGQTLDDVQNIEGEDGVGAYHGVKLTWQAGTLPMKGEIRIYQGRPVVIFSETSGKPAEMPPAPFPAFTNVPPNLHLFSYQQKTFAPPIFAASDCSTPWLLFDDQANAVVISPASHFMVAAMSGDGHQEIASGFNSRLRNLPAGFTQQTILVFGRGINDTWDTWGKSLLALQGLKRPGINADTVSKYFGYWTDNGAYYYYNYDLDKGYEGTLEALVAHYRQENIPLHYLQLDSWWYYKTFTGPDGKIGKTKAPKLPEGEWNRYGGLLEYRAHPALFPDGLSAFQESINLPLVTHNRWIDPASPYHQKYKISGVAAIDPKWWDDIADYLKANGIVTYEQDWLDRIYRYSPAFSSTVDTADEFLDNMARACRERGITVQYCMPYPCHFLQGSHYENLTTIRTSDDRFGPDRYNAFLYVSRLADSMGIWPWSDVFLSTETNNLLLATLSAGPVGIGDAMGREDQDNIFKSVRRDGVIVKPDAPAVPLDQSYLSDARGDDAPLVAATYTDHDGYKTEYVFAFNRSKSGGEALHFSPAELGFTGPVVVYDYFSGQGTRLDSAATYSTNLEARAVGYYVVAPFGKSGVAFLGDAGKFVSTGKQRIASLQDQKDGLTATVLFAPNENSLILHGYSALPFKVTAQAGQAKILKYVTSTGYFEVSATPDPSTALETIDGDPARVVSVTLATQ